MRNIDIEWLTDDHDCETCGWTHAEGAIVKVDGEVILELVPSAYCCGSDHWNEGDVWKLTLERLGFNLRDSYQEAPNNG